MRLLFVLALALLILPLSGCAKKKTGDSSSPPPAASNASSNANYDASMGGAGHGMENPMMEEPTMGGHGEGSETPEEYTTPEVTTAEGENANLDDMYANIPVEGSQNRNYFNQGAGGQGGHGQGQANTNPPAAGGHGQGAGGYNPNGNAASGGHGQVKTNNNAPSAGGHGQGAGGYNPNGNAASGGHGQVQTNNNAPAAGGHGQGAGGYNPNGNASSGGHGQARPANNTPSAASHDQPGTKAPAAGGQGSGGSKFSEVAGQVVDFFTGGDSKPKTKPASHGEGEMPVVEEEPSAEGEGGMVPADMNMAAEGEGGMGEGGMGEGGQPAQAPKKATDIPGVEEGSPEQAAVALILKVARGEAEGLSGLIAEDAKGMLGGLRKGDEKAMAEAKELMGRVRKNSSRLDDRDTVIYFENNKRQILQFYVRKIQGEHVVREIRVHDAAPARRRR